MRSTLDGRMLEIRVSVWKNESVCAPNDHKQSTVHGCLVPRLGRSRGHLDLSPYSDRISTPFSTTLRRKQIAETSCWQPVDVTRSFTSPRLDGNSGLTTMTPFSKLIRRHGNHWPHGDCKVQKIRQDSS